MTTKLAKHTPGPWFISGGRYLGIVAIVDGVRRQIGRAEDCNGLIADDMVIGNAALMKSAPAMLEALEGIIESATDGRGIPEWLEERLIYAKAAILAAVGEQEENTQP